MEAQHRNCRRERFTVSTATMLYTIFIKPKIRTVHSALTSININIQQSVFTLHKVTLRFLKHCSTTLCSSLLELELNTKQSGPTEPLNVSIEWNIKKQPKETHWVETLALIAVQ